MCRFIRCIVCRFIYSTVCGDKKAVEISIGSTCCGKRCTRPVMMGSPLTNSQNIKGETDTPSGRTASGLSLWKMQHRKMWITVETLEGPEWLRGSFDPQEQVCRFYNKTLCETAVSPVLSPLRSCGLRLWALKHHVLDGNENSTMGYDGTQ